MVHIAKLAARQRTAKKTGRPQMVNCQMRVKPAAPLLLNGETFISFVYFNGGRTQHFLYCVVQKTLYRGCMLKVLL